MLAEACGGMNTGEGEKAGEGGGYFRKRIWITISAYDGIRSDDQRVLQAAEHAVAKRNKAEIKSDPIDHIDQKGVSYETDGSCSLFFLP